MMILLGFFIGIDDNANMFTAQSLILPTGIQCSKKQKPTRNMNIDLDIWSINLEQKMTKYIDVKFD